MRRNYTTRRRRLPYDTGVVVPGVRDPLLHPFPSDWWGNMPIGSGAQFVDPNLPMPSQTQLRTDGINIGVNVNDPLKAFSRSTWHFAQDGSVVNVPTGFTVPAGTLVRVPTSMAGDGKMNEIAVFLDQNGLLWECQPLLLDQVAPYPDGPDVDDSVWQNPRAAYIAVRGVDPRLSPTDGGHGGSGITAFGLTIREWEWNNSDTEFGHALAMNIPPSLMSATGTGYRAPATKADSNYDIPGSNNEYTGTVPALKPGALLTWRPGRDLSSVTNLWGKKIVNTINKRGVYIVDSTGTASVFQLSVEKTIEQDFLTKTAAFSATVMAHMIQLEVVDNNGPGNWGGGGTTLRADILPALAEV